MSKAQEEAQLGSDLRLSNVNSLGADLYVSNIGDIAIAADEQNLAQAILHRLRTDKGELSELGHPDYGSNLFDFVGQPNDWTTRSRLRLAIRDAIRQEPRVKEIVSVAVDPILHSEKFAGQGATQMTIAQSSTGGDSEAKNSSELAEAEVRVEPALDQRASLNSVFVEIVVTSRGSNKQVQLTFPINLEVA